MKFLSTVVLALVGFSSSLKADVVVNGEAFKGAGWPKALSCPNTSGPDTYIDAAALDATLSDFITRLVKYNYKPFDTTWNLAVGGACSPDKLKTSKPLWVMGVSGAILTVAIDVKSKEFWFCGAQANAVGPSGYPLGCDEIQE